ncbi:TolC family protein [Kordia sp.]|uniref:TolC family protein n=1 Tax=Kordia sp. TaxID=1965332 RepID=UPI0025BE5230|nr:TolC family protein [Kordia sp.]MCH2196674.1 TolC family protein [Kordia sp.]
MRNFFLIALFLCATLTFAQGKKTYDVGILLDNRTAEINPLLEQLENQIKVVVGQDANINFSERNILVNNYDLQKAEQHYNTLLQNETDIILAFGVMNSVILNKQSVYVKPTILFGAINQDVTGIDLSKKTSEINNFTYLIESRSYKDDLKRLKELTNFKKVGIIIERQLVDVLQLQKAFDPVVKDLDAAYTIIPFSSVADITNNLTDVDAVYIAGGFFLKDEEVKELAKTFIAKKLPSFTINGRDQVKAGFMATNQTEDNFDQFMRRISLIIESYVNGTPLSEQPVFIEYNSRLTVNYNTTELVDVPIKYSLINDTDFVGEFKNAISEKQYNLLTVIEGVLNKNLSLQSLQKDIELKNQDVKTAKSNYLPSLTAAATGTYVDPKLAEISNGQNPEFSTAGNLTLQQTVFSESANANIDIQKNLQKAQQENYNAEELNTIFDASNAYFNALILKANAQIRLRNLGLTKRNLQLAKQNFDAGQSGKSDMLRFRSEMAQNTQVMVEAANQLEQAFIILNQLLNNPVSTEIDIEDVELDKGIFKNYNYDQITELLDDPKLREPFIEFLIQEAQNNAPELKALGYNLDATERNIQLNGNGRFLPTVALQGQYNRTFSRSGVGTTFPTGFPATPDGNYNIGVNVSIPIFNRTQTNINKQIAIIQKDQLEINRDNTKLSISANIRNSVLNLVNQISNIELSKVSEETAKESLELTQTSYSNGAVNVVQLLDAQNNYLNAQLSRTNAIYNYLINALQLERYLGYYFLLNSESENAKFRQRFLEFLNNKN